MRHPANLMLKTYTGSYFSIRHCAIWSPTNPVRFR
jgi:hypothetical protein